MTYPDAVAHFQQDVSLRRISLVQPAASNKHNCTRWMMVVIATDFAVVQKNCFTSLVSNYQLQLTWRRCFVLLQRNTASSGRQFSRWSRCVLCDPPSVIQTWLVFTASGRPSAKMLIKVSGDGDSRPETTGCQDVCGRTLINRKRSPAEAGLINLDMMLSACKLLKVAAERNHIKTRGSV